MSRTLRYISKQATYPTILLYLNPRNQTPRPREGYENDLASPGGTTGSAPRVLPGDVGVAVRSIAVRPRSLSLCVWDPWLSSLAILTGISTDCLSVGPYESAESRNTVGLRRCGVGLRIASTGISRSRGRSAELEVCCCWSVLAGDQEMVCC